MLHGENERRCGPASAFEDQLDLVLFHSFCLLFQVYLHCLKKSYVMLSKRGWQFPFIDRPVPFLIHRKPPWRQQVRPASAIHFLSADISTTQCSAQKPSKQSPCNTSQYSRGYISGGYSCLMQCSKPSFSKFFLAWSKNRSFHSLRTKSLT
jgi:hypothetical protein